MIARFSVKTSVAGGVAVRSHTRIIRGHGRDLPTGIERSGRAPVAQRDDERLRETHRRHQRAKGLRLAGLDVEPDLFVLWVGKPNRFSA
jgi:hypothetical protein